jgi:thioredoxin reductase
MTDTNHFEVIIIGGSYSGLSAAMGLARALREVLIVDSGAPCNKQTPHSHNFITQDGNTPSQISSLAKDQVLKYATVKFINGTAVNADKTDQGFSLELQSGELFHSKKLIFATGIKDIMPAVKGLAECWGISVIHCPYCHGYEVRNEKTGILANGDAAFDFAKLILNWTKELTLFTNGKSTLSPEQSKKLQAHGIKIIEDAIDSLEQQNGKIQHINFSNGSKFSLTALYARPPFRQHCEIPEKLGCELTELGHLKTDGFQKTTVKGVFACGDNVTMMRSVSNAVATGTLAAAMVNKELIDEDLS